MGKTADKDESIPTTAMGYIKESDYLKEINQITPLIEYIEREREILTEMVKDNEKMEKEVDHAFTKVANKLKRFSKMAKSKAKTKDLGKDRDRG